MRWMLAMTLALTGCGTLVTATAECERLGPYSGTRASAQGPHTFIDVPFSLLLDTLLLPVTIPKAIVEPASDDTSSLPPKCRPGPVKPGGQG